MDKTIKILGLSIQARSLEELLLADNVNKDLRFEWNFIDDNLSSESLEQQVKESDICVASGNVCLSLSETVKYRSVASHFINYIDFVTKQEGKLWGQSVFSEVFLGVLLKTIQNQDFKGSVIFLGNNPLVLPTLEVLARFGFEDFVFVDLEDNGDFDYYQKHLSGILKTKISKVDSTAFIRSQKEYSLCFVMRESYSQQTLDDMSYFHFLSSQSIVFDLSGNSNFLFKEVKALGVSVTEHKVIAQLQKQKIVELILQYASKVS